MSGSRNLFDSRLSIVESRFIAAYLISLEGKAAVEQVTPLRGQEASMKAVDLLKRPQVKQAIEEQLEAQNSRILLTADRVLQEIMALAMYDIKDAFDDNGDPLPISQLPESLRRAIEGFETEEIFRPGTKSEVKITKYKFTKKQGPLQMLAEHLRLVVQKFEVTGANGKPLNPHTVDLSDVSTALLERILNAGEKERA